jgi:hypothetical protein
MWQRRCPLPDEARLHCGGVEKPGKRLRRHRAAQPRGSIALICSQSMGELLVGAYSGHAVSHCILDTVEMANEQQAGAQAMGKVWEENLVLLGTVSDGPNVLMRERP